jgi:serpin B
MNRRFALLFALVLAVGGCAGAASSPGPSAVGQSPSPSSPATSPSSPATSPSSPAFSPLPGISLAQAQLPRASADPGAAAGAAGDLDAFGFDLLHAIGGGGGGNIVFSPASIGLALAMAELGAKGQTAAQMNAVLHGVAADGGLGLNALSAALAARSGSFKDSAGRDIELTLRIANAPFAQAGLALEPAFLDALASQFGAGLREVDYAADPDGARALINGWVKDETAGRIPELLAPGVISRYTKLTLVNAIYLKAPWETAFDKAGTAAAPFTRADGSVVSVPTMSGGEQATSYAAGPGWQAVQLPYANDTLAMTIILPDNLASFVAGLDGAQFARITGALVGRQVDLSLPRFKVQTQVDLAKTLGSLGMPLAFIPGQADFSGITSEVPLNISAVIHQANISVDEQGTEAAAATAVVMVGLAAPAQPVTVKVDHPFLFAVRDLASGAVLFLGQVTDPSAGG